MTIAYVTSTYLAWHTLISVTILEAVSLSSSVLKAAHCSFSPIHSTKGTHKVRRGAVPVQGLDQVLLGCTEGFNMS